MRLNLFGWLAPTIFAIMATAWSVAVMWPGSYWIYASTIEVSDAQSAMPVVMLVDRVVSREFQGRYHATVEHRTVEGWKVVSPQCERVSSWIPYAPDRVLPFGDDLNLHWWVGGDCVGLEPGTYRVTTTWEVHRSWLPNVLTKPFTSNIFVIAAS